MYAYGSLETKETEAQTLPLEILPLSLRKCVNTEFEWEFKQGFVKAAKSSAVCLR